MAASWATAVKCGHRSISSWRDSARRLRRDGVLPRRCSRRSGGDIVWGKPVTKGNWGTNVKSARVFRQIALVTGAAAVVATGALTACSKEKPAETKPSSSAPAVSPTEKVNVGSFAPSVTARPAPTALPGNVITGS